MTPIEKLKLKLTSVADAIRDRTGDTEKLSLDQMTEEIEYMPAGDDGETYILVDEEGNEIPAVLTNDEVDLTATPNDIRLGSIAVTDDGVITGEKEIPSYYVSAGQRFVTNGRRFILPTPDYDYSKFQALICPFNRTLDDSVYTEKIVINDAVYEVLSTDAITAVIKDSENTRVDLGIMNDSGSIYLLRYFMYKEVY